MSNHRDHVTQQIRAIPPERLAVKIRNTLIGLAMILLAVGAAWKLAWPWYVVVPIAVYGGFWISQDLTKKAVAFVAAMIKDLLAAVRGKNGP